MVFFIEQTDGKNVGNRGETLENVFFRNILVKIVMYLLIENAGLIKS